MITARVERSNDLSPRTSTVPARATATAAVRTTGRRAPCGTARCAGRRHRGSPSRSTNSWRASSSSFTRSSSPSSRTSTPSVGTSTCCSAKPRLCRELAGLGRLGDPGEELERLCRLAAGDEQPRQADDRRPGGRARARERCRSDASSPAATSSSASDGAGASRATNSSTSARPNRTDEAVDDLAVLDRHHRGNRLDLERGRDPGVLVDVHLGELDRSPRRIDHVFEDRPERAARPAPGRPEVDHDRHLLGPVEDRTARNRRRSHLAPPDRRYPGGAAARLRWPTPGPMRLVRCHERLMPLASLAMTQPDHGRGDQTWSRVTEWFEENVEGTKPPLDFSLVAGGRSNLTYRVTDSAGNAWALRRPPVSHVLPTAHDMAREHRMMSSLGPTDVPVPRTCRAVRGPRGERRPVLRDGVRRRLHPPRRAGGRRGTRRRTAGRTAGESMADTLATIHAVDVDAVGLGDFAKRDGYAARQLKRWLSQFESSPVEGFDSDGTGRARPTTGSRPRSPSRPGPRSSTGTTGSTTS